MKKTVLTKKQFANVVKNHVGLIFNPAGKKSRSFSDSQSIASFKVLFMQWMRQMLYHMHNGCGKCGIACDACDKCDITCNIALRLTIETPYQYCTSTTCPARGYLLCVEWHRRADPVAMVPPPGRGNGDDGVDPVTQGGRGI